MADPGVDKDKVYLVGVGAGNPAAVLTLPSALKEGQVLEVKGGKMKIGKMTLPEGLKPDEVTFSSEYSDGADEDLRTVREVNEDPHDVLKVTVRKTIPVALDRIVLSFRTESE